MNVIILKLKRNNVKWAVQSIVLGIDGGVPNLHPLILGGNLGEIVDKTWDENREKDCAGSGQYGHA